MDFDINFCLKRVQVIVFYFIKSQDRNPSADPYIKSVQKPIFLQKSILVEVEILLLFKLFLKITMLLHYNGREANFLFLISFYLKFITIPIPVKKLFF